VCDNPPCCDVSRLLTGTNLDNTTDMISKGRNHNLNVTHCPQDHEYNEVNTHVDAVTGWRRCRVCNRIAAKDKRNH